MFDTLWQRSVRRQDAPKDLSCDNDDEGEDQNQDEYEDQDYDYHDCDDDVICGQTLDFPAAG